MTTVHFDYRLIPEEMEDDILIDVATQCCVRGGRLSIVDLEISRTISERLEGYLLRANKPDDAYECLLQEMEAEYGMDYGLVLPSQSGGNWHVPVLANGSHLSSLTQFAQRELWTEQAELLRRTGVRVFNSWHQLGDREISVIEAADGTRMAWWKYDAGNRLRKLMNGLAVRNETRLTAETELRALESLKARITENQFRTYVLNDCFTEHSKRSDLYYLFRKGKPTLAMSFHNVTEGRCLAALCMHPYGYYPGTHAGVMAPTDEVIAALLMFRTDEHMFWKKSGQWRSSDPRSGI